MQSIVTQKKTKASLVSIASKDSQPSKYSVLTKKNLHLIIKVEEKLIQLFRVPYKLSHKKSTKDRGKRVADQRALEEANPQVVVDLALTRLSFLIALTLMNS